MKKKASKKKYQCKISLHPLTVDEALRAALHTPPPPKALLLMPPKKKTASKPKSWQNYEELARHVLLHFADIVGISSVEAKQRLQGQSENQWEIDAKGICSDGTGFLVIECKERKSSRLNRDTIATLAYKVQAVGAAGAVIITSIGLQKGAKKLASQLGFHEVYLPKESTFENFVARCGNCILRKLPPERLGCSVSLVSMSVYDQKQEKKD